MKYSVASKINDVLFFLIKYNPNNTKGNPYKISETSELLSSPIN